MDWTGEDLATLGGMSLFALAIVGLAELLERHDRKAYMYGIDSHADCVCAHRGYEHSFRSGICRFETIIAGLVYKCYCKGFREATDTEELV